MWWISIIILWKWTIPEQHLSHRFHLSRCQHHLWGWELVLAMRPKISCAWTFSSAMHGFISASSTWNAFWRSRMANTDENIIIEDIQVLSSFNVHLEEDGRLTQTTQRWQIVKKKKKIQIFQGNKCKKSFQKCNKAIFEIH